MDRLREIFGVGKEPRAVPVFQKWYKSKTL